MAKSNLLLKNHPTLSDIQEYVIEMEKVRGFSDETLLQQCLLLVEEVGELFKSIRKSEGIKTDPNSKVGEKSQELADVFIFLMSIANRLNIDMEKAFREKEEINKDRIWN